MAIHDGSCSGLYGSLTSRVSALQMFQRTPQLVPGGSMQRLSSAEQPSHFWPWRSALVAVSPLGRVQHAGQSRGVIGIFYDTSDTHASDFGIAGVWGSFSDDQLQRIQEMVRALQGQEGYADPLFVLFGHHPLDEMAYFSRKRLDDLIASLDRAGARSDDPEAGDSVPPHVIGLVVAACNAAARCAVACACVATAK